MSNIIYEDNIFGSSSSSSRGALTTSAPPQSLSSSSSLYHHPPSSLYGTRRGGGNGGGGVNGGNGGGRAAVVETTSSSSSCLYNHIKEFFQSNRSRSNNNNNDNIIVNDKKEGGNGVKKLSNVDTKHPYVGKLISYENKIYKVLAYDTRQNKVYCTSEPVWTESPVIFDNNNINNIKKNTKNNNKQQQQQQQHAVSKTAAAVTEYAPREAGQITFGEKVEETDFVPGTYKYAASKLYFSEKELVSCIMNIDLPKLKLVNDSGRLNFVDYKPVNTICDNFSLGSTHSIKPNTQIVRPYYIETLEKEYNAFDSPVTVLGYDYWNNRGYLYDDFNVLETDCTKPRGLLVLGKNVNHHPDMDIDKMRADSSICLFGRRVVGGSNKDLFTFSENDKLDPNKFIFCIHVKDLRLFVDDHHK